MLRKNNAHQWVVTIDCINKRKRRKPFPAGVYASGIFSMYPQWDIYSPNLQATLFLGKGWFPCPYSLPVEVIENKLSNTMLGGVNSPLNLIGRKYAKP